MVRRNTLMLVAGAAIIVAGMAMVPLGPPAEDPDYTYEVKSEQVQQADDVENATPLEELDGDHRAAIFDAFKKSDHFLGGSSATIESDERLDLSEDERWQVVEIEGVPLLVGVSGPEVDGHLTSWGGLSIAVMMVGYALAIIGLMNRVGL